MKIKNLIFLLVIIFSSCCLKSESKRSIELSVYQKKFARPGSVYYITHDLNLQGKKIIIPNACKLIYQGGKIRNGTIEFDNTKLIGKVNNENIDIEGVIANDTVYTSWFFKSKVLEQDEINKLVGVVYSSVIIFDRDYILNSNRKFTGESTHNKYYYDGINIKSGITYDGNGHTIFCGTADNIFNCIFDFSNNDFAPRENWKITNFVLARSLNDQAVKQTEATSIYIRNAIRGEISNCRFLRWKGQGIHISLLPINGKEYHSRQLVVRDCVFKGTLGSETFTSGNGLNIISGQDINVINCQFYNIKTDAKVAGKWPGAIDIETEEYHSNVDNVIIDSCIIENCGWLSPVSFASRTDLNGNIEHHYGGGDGTVYVKNLKAKNCEYAISVQNGLPCGHVVFDHIEVEDIKSLSCISNTTMSIEVRNSVFRLIRENAIFPNQVKTYNCKIFK